MTGTSPIMLKILLVVSLDFVCLWIGVLLDFTVDDMTLVSISLMNIVNDGILIFNWCTKCGVCIAVARILLLNESWGIRQLFNVEKD